MSRPTGVFSGEDKQGGTRPSYFPLPYCKQAVHLVTRFSHSRAFCRWSRCLEWPPRVIFKCYLVFRSTGRLLCALWGRYMRWTSFIQAQVVGLLAVSSMVMNQQRMLNKASLNRNTHKTSQRIDHLTVDENIVTRGSQGPNPVFFLQIEFTVQGDVSDPDDRKE